MAAAWERHPGQPVPGIFPGPTEPKAVYRFLHNGKVSEADILQPHREALLERMRLESTMLLVQDTATLNHTGLGSSARVLGPLRECASSACGLFVHAAVGFTEGMWPLGDRGVTSGC